ncbi:MAG TPA: HD domain-containing protein [Burkholderiales bacterium]|nr:HD domain-containing protein [Burkholderiales bacterium]
MVEDVRVVLIRLASRTQTLRWFAKNATQERALYARESLDIYSPLASSSPCNTEIARAMYCSRSTRFSSSMPAMRL